MPFYKNARGYTIYYQIHSNASECSFDSDPSWAPLHQRIIGDNTRSATCPRGHQCVEKTAQKNPLGYEEQRAVFIMGFASPHTAWKSQVDGLLSQSRVPLSILILDNVGIGQSSDPREPRHCTTEALAGDAADLAASLGWDSYHVIGHSMGGMIAQKLAVRFAPRVLSLTLLSTMAGCGTDKLPSWGALKLIPKMIKAKKSVDAKVAFDFACHYTRRFLHEPTAALTPSEPGAADAAALASSSSSASASDRESGSSLVKGTAPRHTVLKALYRYAIARDGRQKRAGEEGHFHAVSRHKLLAHEVAVLRGMASRVLVVHGRKDVIITAASGAKLARKIGAPFLLLDGAHMLNVERAVEVNQQILSLIESHAAGPQLTAGLTASRGASASEAALAAAAGTVVPSSMPESGGGGAAPGPVTPGATVETDGVHVVAGLGSPTATESAASAASAAGGGGSAGDPEAAQAEAGAGAGVVGVVVPVR